MTHFIFCMTSLINRHNQRVFNIKWNPLCTFHTDDGGNQLQRVWLTNKIGRDEPGYNHNNQFSCATRLISLWYRHITPLEIKWVWATNTCHISRPLQYKDPTQNILIHKYFQHQFICQFSLLIHKSSNSFVQPTVQNVQIFCWLSHTNKSYKLLLPFDKLVPAIFEKWRRTDYRIQ